jgi:hypothetical protein
MVATLAIPLLLTAMLGSLVRHNARAVAFFRDFDKLRTGYITTAQFQRGLKAMLPAASFVSLPNRLGFHPLNSLCCLKGLA